MDEVDSRLRSVRAQASKARRYREYSDRLQELRTHVGWSDWRTLTSRLNELESELHAKRELRGEQQASLETLQENVREHEQNAESLGAEVRKLEADAAAHAQTIVRAKSEIRHQQNRCEELNSEAARRRTRLFALSGKAGNASLMVHELRQQVAQAKAEHAAAQDAALQAEEAVGRCDQQAEAIRQSSEMRRAAYMEQMRLAAETGNRVQTLEESLAACQERLEALTRQRQDLRHESEANQEASERIDEQLQVALEQRRQLQGECESLRVAVEELDAQGQQRQHALAHAEGRLASLLERVEHLGNIERQLHGVHGGAKQMLEIARGPSPGVFADVEGLVAEILDAPLDIASLVDVALGPAAQYVVVRTRQLTDAIARGEVEPAGPVSVLSLQDIPAAAGKQLDLTGRNGVRARLSDMVRFTTEFGPLADWLLGDAWLVHDIETASRLWRLAPGAARFITADGAVMQRSGALEMGSPQAAAGLVSRRSELRAVQASAEQFTAQTRAMKQQCGSLAAELAGRRADLSEKQSLLNEVGQELTQLQSQRATLEDRQQRVEKQLHELQATVAATQTQQQQLAESLEHSQTALAELEAVLAEIDGQLQQAQARLEAQDEERQRLSSQATSARVQLARSDQRLESLLGQLQRLEEDSRDRQRSIEEAFLQLDLHLRRRAEAELETLRHSADLAQAYWDRQELEQGIRQVLSERADVLDARQQIHQQHATLTKKIRSLEQAEHQLELDASQVRHQRESLVERLRDEYGVEIGGDPQDAPLADQEQQQEREGIDQEIADLRRKIHRIGPVNIDALDELDAIEERYNGLAAQYNDLKEAKETLERIIHRINGDSRRLFVETMDAIRGNFRTLFRQAFGGGQADLVMDQGVDVLEAGVDIVATPPGKPAFSNSLLSGGEKALTAVALLLAIFQFRPSPFCILDEVDAPFDEANISRFLDVLREFLGWTKFVVVTHSKKTMTSANTLYGVTMQESGVSKKVSVRFEDVREDGQFEVSGEQQTEVA